LSERLTRIQVYIKGTYELKGNRGDCNIVDISEGGIGLSVRQTLVPGDLVHVNFRIPLGKEEDVDFWGIVRNVNNNIIGLKYEEITHDNIDRIDGYVSLLLNQSGKMSKEDFDAVKDK
jgi:hypothetical protein